MEESDSGGPVRMLQAQVAALNDLLAVQEQVVCEESARLEQVLRERDEQIQVRARAEKTLRENEAKFRAIFDQTFEFIGLMTPDGTLIDANPSALKLAGVEAAKVLGKPFWDTPWWAHSPEMQDKLRAAVGEAAQGRFMRFEATHPEPDGSVHYIDFSLKPVRDENGHVVLLIPEGRDITESKKAQERLRESENRYHEFFAMSRDCVFITNKSGNWIASNDAALEMFGYDSLEELYQVPISSRYVHPKERSALLSMIEKQGHVKEHPAQLRRKDGTIIDALITSGFRLNEDGSGREYYGTIRDITARKRAEENVRRYAAQLEQANEEVKQFAYIVSHDLRAPLVNLKGFAGELRSSLNTLTPVLEAALSHLAEERAKEGVKAAREEMSEALGFIDSSATQMDHLVNALLTLSRLGRRELRLEALNVEELVLAALNGLAHQIDSATAHVCLGALPDVVADRTSMEQIMGNILGNAVKYLEPGRPGRIEIFGERGETATTFIVRDNGRGIAQEDMFKVFAPFRRAGKQNVPGEGMGMAYVQALVRRHGGQIHCESELGVGTTFTFSLPHHLDKGGGHGCGATD